MRFIYPVLKDIIKFFQDNYALIKANIWVFLLFAAIVSFTTFLITKTVYGKKQKAFKKENNDLPEENKELLDTNIKLHSDVNRLTNEIEKLGTFKILEEKRKPDANDTYSDQLYDEFASMNP